MTLVRFGVLAGLMIGLPVGSLVSAQNPQATQSPQGASATKDRVQVVVYSDFQCPFCAQFAGPLRELHQKGLDGVELDVVFKHFPLAIHPAARLAHRAALAAGEQGKFWEMHDLLFANQARIQRTDLVGYAQKLGLDMGRFEKDLDTPRYEQTIAADTAEGERVGVTGTPTFTVNGKVYSGTRTLPQLTELIAGDRRRQRALAEITDDLLSDGPANAPVTIELFADLQSPVTRPALDVVRSAMARYPGKVRLQFRNFPLAFHPQAALAHESAMLAAKAGRFWPFVDLVLGHQGTLREQDLIVFAQKVGLNEAQFAEALGARRYGPRVDADLETGRWRGTRGSPAVVVGDKRFDGVPAADALVAAIDAVMASAAPTARRP